jgi:TnpA family transposase
MPRRSTLSNTERESLLSIPEDQDELVRLYTFNEADLTLIHQHRGAQNRLGFAVQLCYMRYPAILLATDAIPFAPLLRIVSDQLKVSSILWSDYGKREQTRREHLAELQTAFGFRTFTTLSHYRMAVHELDNLAWQTDKGIVLARTLVESLRSKNILLPTINVIERI